MLKENLKEKINNCLAKNNKKYSCKTVSWDDVSRFSSSSGLSSVGNNITDSYLVSKNGNKLYTIRPDNWNERVGIIDSNDFRMITSSKKVVNGKLINSESVLLTDFLKKNLSKEINCENLFNENLDKQISVRFQTTFLPIQPVTVEDDFNIISEEFIEFCPETFNYNTKSDDDPKNVLVLCTSEGSFVSLDKKGPKKLFRYTNNKNEWFRIEPTKFSVGTSQTESETEQIEQINSGKSIADYFGLESMKNCMNCIATIQIPLKTKQETKTEITNYFMNGPFQPFPQPKPYPNPYQPGLFPNPDISFPVFPPKITPLPNPIPFKPNYPMYDYEKKNSLFTISNNPDMFEKNRVNITKKPCDSRSLVESSIGSSVGSPFVTSLETSLGTSIGRISKGSEEGERMTMTTKRLERDSSQHITITFIFYYITDENGPGEKDILTAIEELENHVRLHDLKSDEMSFMKTNKESF